MKKDDTYKDKGLRVAVQHKNDTAGKMTLSEDFTDRLMQRIEQQDEKPVQHRMKFWPWIAAACVAAFLVVLLAPPRKEAITEPQIAKVEPKTKSVEVKTAEPEERHLSQAISPIKRRKKRPKIEHPRSTDISTSEDEAIPLTAEIIVPTAEATLNNYETNSFFSDARTVMCHISCTNKSEDAATLRQTYGNGRSPQNRQTWRQVSAYCLRIRGASLLQPQHVS